MSGFGTPADVQRAMRLLDAQGPARAQPLDVFLRNLQQLTAAHAAARLGEAPLGAAVAAGPAPVAGATGAAGVAGGAAGATAAAGQAQFMDLTGGHANQPAAGVPAAAPAAAAALPPTTTAQAGGPSVGPAAAAAAALADAMTAGVGGAQLTAAMLAGAGPPIPLSTALAAGPPDGPAFLPTSAGSAEDEVDLTADDEQESWSSICQRDARQDALVPSFLKGSLPSSSRAATAGGRGSSSAAAAAGAGPSSRSGQAAAATAAAATAAAAAAAGQGAAAGQAATAGAQTAAGPMLYVQGLLDSIGRRPVLEPPPGEVDNLAVHVCELTSGPVELAVSLNFCASFAGLFHTCPNLLSVPHLVVAEHHASDAAQELAALRLNGARLPARVDLHRPALRDPGSRGCHHTKACLLKYPTGLRVIIFTGTPDREDRTPLLQGVWWQDFPPAAPELPDGCPVVQLRPTSEFGGVLFDFVSETLRGFQRPGMLTVLRAIARHDFSLPRASLVGSVPGPQDAKHTGPGIFKWGHMRLRTLLQRHGLLPFDGTVLSCTASLNWITGAAFEDYRASFSGADLRILWVARDTVRFMMQSGLLGENSLGAQKSAISTKEVRERLYYHDGTEITGREKCPPHIKQTAWIREDGQLAAVMVGSHNFSMAAWGVLTKDKASLFIRSYELSVLSLPSVEEAWRRSPQFGFTCTAQPWPGAPPPGPDPLMAGCARVEFVPFSADSPEARAPCAVMAADGSPLLRLPVPLTFSTNPGKWDDLEGLQGGGLALRGLGSFHGVLEQAKGQGMEQIMIEEAIKQSLSGSGVDDRLVAAALALEEEAGRRNRKRQREGEPEDEVEERDDLMQQALLQSLESCKEDEEAALQRTLLASLQRGGQRGSGGQLGQQAQQGGEDEEAPLQRVLLESLQGGGQQSRGGQRGQHAQQGSGQWGSGMQQAHHAQQGREEEEDVELQKALLASMQG